MSEDLQPRTLSRRCATQAIYQWQLTGFNLGEIERQFVEEHGLGNADAEYFKELLHGVPARLDEIDAAMREFVNRPIPDIDPVERAVLRIGIYELLFHPELPYRVVLNEGINLAKTFGSETGHKFVNGVLDRVAHQARATEVAAFARKRR